MFPKGLIVSSQALEGNPMLDTEKLVSMAEAAAIGGASALRVNGAEVVSELAKRVTVPIIGINKVKDETGRTVITPNFELAKEVTDAGASIVALDATFYPSSLREDLKTLIDKIHNILGAKVMADISTPDEAEAAALAGADAVSTTLAGYIPGALHSDEELYTPNFDIIKEISSRKLPVTLVAEGRFWRPEDVAKAYSLGADAVVIGKAITNPMATTRYFINRINEAKQTVV